MVAKEFGIAPWEVMDADVSDVMKTYTIMVTMQPKPKGPSRA